MRDALRELLLLVQAHPALDHLLTNPDSPWAYADERATRALDEADGRNAEAKKDSPIIEGAWRAKAAELRVFKVDDGDGSGAEARCDLSVSHNGEAGSGGKLQRLRPEQVDELIAALQQARARMGSQ